MDKPKEKIQLSYVYWVLFKAIARSKTGVVGEEIAPGKYNFHIVENGKKTMVFRPLITKLLDAGFIKEATTKKECSINYKITKAGSDLINNRKPGGAREGTGIKTMYPDHVSMEVRLPEKDKLAIRAKYGRGFNEVFRGWVKSLIS